jgi:hypothetical protein
MRKTLFMILSILVISSMLLTACAAPAAAPEAATPAGEAAPTTEGGPVVEEGQAATVVEASDLLPPVIAQPCEGDDCFCTGKTVSVIVNTAGEKGPISRRPLAPHWKLSKFLSPSISPS